ncbi:MAG: polysaccharide biosynthesis tyrosine autokinase [Cyanobacteria bacterium J06626_14]
MAELQSSPVSVLPQDSEQEGGLQLGRLLSPIKRHVFLVVGVATLTAVAAVLDAVTDTPTYRSSFELLTPATTLETQIISTLNPQALSNQSDVVDVALDETKLKVLTSPRVMEPIVENLQERYPNITYRRVVRNLRITSDDNGNTLTVQYTGNDSDQVLHVLEVVSEAYVRFSLEDRQNNIFRGIDFVNEQLPEVRGRVEELESELESLRQRSNLIDPLLQGEQLTAQTARFTAEQLDLRVQIRQAQEIYENLGQELAAGEEFAATSTLMESARYQELLNQLLEVDRQLAEELTLYIEGSPEIEVIQERRENLQPLLAREGIRVQGQLASYILELQDRDQALSTTIEILNQQIKNLSTTAREYNKIQRDLEIATVNLNQFLTKREALRIDAAQRQTPWEVLTPPARPRASSASARLNLVLGTVLGLLLGSGIAILIDRVRGKVHTIDELKEAVGVPVLGTIPYEPLLADQRSFALETHPGSAPQFFVSESDDFHQIGVSISFLEAFRILATNIQLASPDKSIKTLTISSPIPGMGKSTIAFYLGQAVAATGKRVLIIDADLRHPGLHLLCEISNEKGLSNYASSEFALKEAWTRLSLDSNVFVLPSGPLPPDPIRVLSAQRTKDLFNHAYEEFDMVIFDTPPLLGLADALIVSAQTQGMLLTATLGQVTFSHLSTTLDELGIAKTPLLGAVANESKQLDQHPYGYAYHPQQKSTSNAPAIGIKKTGWHNGPLHLWRKFFHNRHPK